MPSPFPGMDPYLEARWRDVHARLILYSADAIQEQLPAELRAWVEERVVLETPTGHQGGMFPDARVIEYPTRLGNSSGPTKPTETVATEPLILEGEAGTVTEGYVQIIDTSSGNRVVTLLEVLSPTNKLPGEGRQDYLRKQADLRRSTTNLVEIDLLRQGEHVVAVPLSHVPAQKRSPYIVCVRRAARPGKAEVYPIGLQDPLPTIRIPLRPEDADVHLDLQAMLALVYQRGRYDGVLEYARDPLPPLTGPDATWVHHLLVENGLRTASPRKRKRRSE